MRKAYGQLTTNANRFYNLNPAFIYEHSDCSEEVNAAGFHRSLDIYIKYITVSVGPAWKINRF